MNYILNDYSVSLNDLLASYRNSVMGMGFVSVLLTAFNYLNHEILLFHLAVPIPFVYLPNSAT